MLPQEAAHQVDAILATSFRDSERQRNEDVGRLETDLMRHGRIGSGLHRHQVLTAFEHDLERRGRAIQAALQRILELGLVGDTEAVGETLCVAFRERFEEHVRQVEARLPETRSLQGLSLGDIPKTLSAAICGELRLAAREHVLRVRPLPAVDLLPEQEQLLMVLVEASRSVASEARAAFLLSHSHNRPLGRLVHPGLAGKPVDAYSGDVEELATKGLISLRQTDRGDPVFDVRPEGYRYYEELRRRQGAGFERVERIIRTSLDSGRFRDLYPGALECWSQAEAILWRSDVEANLTTVGHTLREGIQQFATALVGHFSPPDVDPDPQHDQARVKAVLALKGESIGKTTRQALEGQWATLSNLVQRLVHGAQREGEPLTWDDARRAVFLAASAMVEVDGVLGATAPKSS